jgi:hypothetical protein
MYIISRRSTITSSHRPIKTRTYIWNTDTSFKIHFTTQLRVICLAYKLRNLGRRQGKSIRDCGTTFSNIHRIYDQKRIISVAHINNVYWQDGNVRQSVFLPCKIPSHPGFASAWEPDTDQLGTAPNVQEP